MIALAGICLLLLFLAIGMPIGFVLLVVGTVGLLLASGFDSVYGILTTSVFRSVNSFTLATIPLFILMAQLLSKSNIAKDLFDCFIKWCGHLPGGAGIATVYASAGFGAVSGTSVAATTIMSNIAVPELRRAKYSDTFSSGMVATCTGTLGVLIPPSVPLVLYGVQTETSIGKLLIAGILPGLLLAGLLTFYIFFYSVKTRNVLTAAPWNERWISLSKIWPTILLAIFVLLFMYLGWGTTSEAAAAGAFGAFIIGLAMKRLNVKNSVQALLETLRQTAMIFSIIIGATVFSYFVTLTRIGNTVISFFTENFESKWVILGFIILFYLILGLFLDMIGSLLLTLPIVFPLVIELGFDPIWFGVIVVVLLEIGLVTPPVGINLYITSKGSGIPVEKVILGSIPFLAIEMILILLLIVFPQIVLYLPNSI